MIPQVIRFHCQECGEYFEDAPDAFDNANPALIRCRYCRPGSHYPKEIPQ